ncbi:MAG: CAP domain-containing protein [Candidatus Aminicenantes bacterium]|nr:CAP domain-containing protein [Candidatus Aminicenantes bacterium]
MSLSIQSPNRVPNWLRVMLALVIAIGAHACQTADTSGLSVTGMEQLVFQKVNEYRRSQGLLDLEWNTDVADLARNHSQDMAEGTVPFGHDGFSGRVSELSSLFRISAAAENVGLTSNLDSAAVVVVDAWIANPTHKDNIEDDFNTTGVGVARNASSDTWYFTQLYVKVRR